MTTYKRIYLRYELPDLSDADPDPKVENVWELKKPHRLFNDDRTFVYEINERGELINERLWDGIE